MKKFFTVCLYVCLSQANAAIINDFTGGYDVSNWTQSLDGGTIDTSGAPGSIMAISSNDAIVGASNTDFTIAALGAGTVTFDWSYVTSDSLGSSFDPFGWLLNDVFTQVTADSSFANQSGTESFGVAAGDVFGFRAFSNDSLGGSATTTISNFSAPSTSVPEPASIALLGLGLAGIGFSRKKKSD